MADTKKPEGYTQEHADYLDGLRDSGATNMLGAGSFLEDRFGLSKNDARDYLLYWMKSFDEED